jgi:hypothetical protein
MDHKSQMFLMLNPCKCIFSNSIELSRCFATLAWFVGTCACMTQKPKKNHSKCKYTLYNSIKLFTCMLALAYVLALDQLVNLVASMPKTLNLTQRQVLSLINRSCVKPPHQQDMSTTS